MGKMTEEQREARNERWRMADLRRKRKERVVSFQTTMPGWQAVEECSGMPDGQRAFVLSPVIGFVLVRCPDRDDHGDYVRFEIRPVISNELGPEICGFAIIPPGFDDRDIPSFVDQTSMPRACSRDFIRDGEGWRLVDRLLGDPPSCPRDAPPLRPTEGAASRVGGSAGDETDPKGDGGPG